MSLEEAVLQGAGQGSVPSAGRPCRRGRQGCAGPGFLMVQLMPILSMQMRSILQGVERTHGIALLTRMTSMTMTSMIMAGSVRGSLRPPRRACIGLGAAGDDWVTDGSSVNDSEGVYRCQQRRRSPWRVRTGAQWR
eukprot:jgi/Mesvir1/29699/Mv25423-RA.1